MGKIINRVRVRQLDANRRKCFVIPSEVDENRYKKPGFFVTDQKIDYYDLPANCKYYPFGNDEALRNSFKCAQRGITKIIEEDRGKEGSIQLFDAIIATLAFVALVALVASWATR